MGRGVEHWLDVGCVLSLDVGDPYEEEARGYFTGETPRRGFDYAEQGATGDRKDSTAQLPLLASEPGEVVSEPAFDEHQGEVEG